MSGERHVCHCIANQATSWACTHAMQSGEGLSKRARAHIQLSTADQHTQRSCQGMYQACQYRSWCHHHDHHTHSPIDSEKEPTTNIDGTHQYRNILYSCVTVPKTKGLLLGNSCQSTSSSGSTRKHTVPQFRKNLRLPTAFPTKQLHTIAHAWPHQCDLTISVTSQHMAQHGT